MNKSHNLKMIIALAAVALLFILASIGGLSLYFKNRELGKKIQGQVTKNISINLNDSTVSAIEKKYQDSLFILARKYEADIKAIHYENSKKRAQNIKHRNAYDSIYVERPDF